MCVLGIEPESSARAVCACSGWATSPALLLNVKCAFQRTPAGLQGVAILKPPPLCSQWSRCNFNHYANTQGPSEHQPGPCVSIFPGYCINQLLISPSQQELIQKCKSYKLSAFTLAFTTECRMATQDSDISRDKAGKEGNALAFLMLADDAFSRLLFQKEN